MVKNVREANRILGIDYGDFTIGLAIFDLKDDFIYPYKTLKREKANILRKSIREIVEIIDKEDIDAVVVGLPLNYDGTEGERVEKVKKFSQMLSIRIEIPVKYQDERLTTKEASSILTDRGIKKSEQKSVIDQVAAEIILQDWRQIWQKEKKS